MIDKELGQVHRGTSTGGLRPVSMGWVPLPLPLPHGSCQGAAPGGSVV